MNEKVRPIIPRTMRESGTYSIEKETNHSIALYGLLASLLWIVTSYVIIGNINLVVTIPPFFITMGFILVDMHRNKWIGVTHKLHRLEANLQRFVDSPDYKDSKMVLEAIRKDIQDILEDVIGDINETC